VNFEDIIVDAAATDTGMRRANNQDSHAIVRASNNLIWRDRGHIFMVADGMGAHAVGEMASKMACDNIPHNYIKTKNLPAVDAMIKAYREVGAQIHSRANLNKEFQGMGTTCTTLTLGPAGALIAHVGDSRIYRIRDGKIEQLSFDHSLAWELVRRNHMKPEQAERAVPKNVITRSLGPDPTVEVDIEGPLPVQQGDVYVLCSDGLSGPVQNPEIGALALNFHPEDACRYLIALANLRGGVDNITAVVVRIGPWVDPTAGTETSEEDPNAGKTKSNGRGFSLTKLLPFGRKPVEEPVEEHIYVTGPAEITEKVLKRLSDTLRHGQAIAIEHSWGVDWPVFLNFQREAETARSENDLRAALRCYAEAITMLGHAGRVHRKEHSQTGTH
jgi:protein phosphatase